MGGGEGEEGKKGRERGDTGRGKRGRHGLREYRCGFEGSLGMMKYLLQRFTMRRTANPLGLCSSGLGIDVASPTSFSPCRRTWSKNPSCFQFFGPCDRARLLPHRGALLPRGNFSHGFYPNKWGQGRGLHCERASVNPDGQGSWRAGCEAMIRRCGGHLSRLISERAQSEDSVLGGGESR